jgi:phosphotransferase system  glucose/maltose/N-acetylglucosamine-specific IIC component
MTQKIKKRLMAVIAVLIIAGLLLTIVLPLAATLDY